MNDKSTSRIPAGQEPKDLQKNRHRNGLADADLPLPKPEDFTQSDYTDRPLRDGDLPRDGIPQTDVPPNPNIPTSDDK